MDRRRFLLTSLAGAVAAPLTAWAQAPARVTVLSPGTPVPHDDLAKAFVLGIHDHGFVDGQDFVLDVRYVGTRADEVDRVVAELLPLRPSVIVTVGSHGAWAAKKATSTIPVVMAVVADPVGQGLVTSLAQPGGNLTGNAILSEAVSSKRLELLHEALPKARRIGVLENTSNPAYAFVLNGLDASAKQLGLSLVRFDAASPGAVETALEQIGRQRPDALLVAQDSLFYLTRAKIVQSVARQRTPGIYPFREAVTEGGLMSYANSNQAMFREAARFVARILRGAKPSDLPVEQARTFELVINLGTAKALGLTIPPSLLARADQVIESGASR